MTRGARSYPAVDCRRPYRRPPNALLASVVFISGCTTTTGAEFTNDLFDKYEVVTGTTPRQTVVPGFFLGGATAELAVVYTDQNDIRRLQMYGLDGGARSKIGRATCRERV